MSNHNGSTSVEAEHSTSAKETYAAAFEAEIAKKCLAPHAIVFGTSRHAWEAIAAVFQISHYDRLFFPTIAPVEVLNLLHFSRPDIHWVDCASHSLSMDLEQLSQRMNQPLSRGREIFIHIQRPGSTVNSSEIDQLIHRTNSIYIEDCSLLLGHPTASGTRSDVSVFSFESGMPLCLGHGAAVTCRDGAIASQLLHFREHGSLDSNWKGPSQYQGSMLESIASLGLKQLKDDLPQAKEGMNTGRRFREELKEGLDIDFLNQDDDCHLISSNPEFVEKARSNGIGLRVTPLYEHPIFSDLKNNLETDFPVTTRLCETCIQLPPLTGWSEDQIKELAVKLKSCVGQK